MKATEQLRDEHEAAKVMLNILERAVAKLEDGKDVDPAHFDQMLEFVTVFLDVCHHGKEEAYLFPPWKRPAFRKKADPSG